MCRRLGAWAELGVLLGSAVAGAGVLAGVGVLGGIGVLVGTGVDVLTGVGVLVRHRRAGGRWDRCESLRRRDTVEYGVSRDRYLPATKGGPYNNRVDSIAILEQQGIDVGGYLERRSIDAPPSRGDPRCVDGPSLTRLARAIDRTPESLGIRRPKAALERPGERRRDSGQGLWGIVYSSSAPPLAEGLSEATLTPAL